MTTLSRFLTLMFATATLFAALPCSAAQRYVWFGTYTGNNSKGIYVSTFDDATGKLTFIDTTPSGGNVPRSFTLSADGELMLVANEYNLICVCESSVVMKLTQNRQLFVQSNVDNC